MGDEPGARQQLIDIGEPMTPEQMDRLVGLALGEVCESMNGAFALDRQPSWLEARLQRSLALVSDWPATHWLAARLALARRDSAPALAHLKTVEDLMGGPGPIAEALKRLASAFPQDQALQEFVNQRLTTQPASTRAEAPEPEGPAGIPVIPFPTAPGEPASEPAVPGPQRPSVTAPAGPPITRPGLPVPPAWGSGATPEQPPPRAPSSAPYDTSSDSGPKSPFIERPAATAPAR